MAAVNIQSGSQKTAAARKSAPIVPEAVMDQLSRHTRTAGTTPVTISGVAAGTLADYVSGTTGNGDVAVRVHCARSDTLAFTSSTDLLKLVYGS